MKYAVATLDFAYNDDPHDEFDNLEDAQVAATERSWDDSAYGIYERRDDEWVIEAIAFGARIFG